MGHAPHRRKHEERINSYPNYTMPVKDEAGTEYTIHFIALFSEKEDAIPLVFYHGWPGTSSYKSSTWLPR